MEFAYIPHVHILEFLKCEGRDMPPPAGWSGKNIEIFLYKKMSNFPTMKNQLGHMW
jgi:hypothetical protein